VERNPSPRVGFDRFRIGFDVEFFLVDGLGGSALGSLQGVGMGLAPGLRDAEHPRATHSYASADRLAKIRYSCARDRGTGAHTGRAPPTRCRSVEVAAPCQASHRGVNSGPQLGRRHGPRGIAHLGGSMVTAVEASNVRDPRANAPGSRS